MKPFTVRAKESEIQKKFKDFVLALDPPSIILLRGNLGAGKTTWVREISALFDVTDQVQSPTFNLLNIYETHENPKVTYLYHFDLYRLSPFSESEMLLEEALFQSQSQSFLAFVEWPERYAHSWTDIGLPTFQIDMEVIQEDTDVNQEQREYRISRII